MSKSNRRRRWQRGAVLVEYSALLVLVAIPAIAGVYLGGKHLVQAYAGIRDNILSSKP